MIGASSAWRRKQQRARRERHQSEEEELAAGAAAAAAARGTAMETITTTTSTTTEADDARARAGRSSSGIKGVYEAEAVVTKSKGLRGLLGWGKRTPPAAAASSSPIAGSSTGRLHPSVQSTVQCTPPGSLRGGVSSGSGGRSSGELHRLGGGGEFGEEEEELTRLGIPSPAPSPRASAAKAAAAEAAAMTEGDDLVLDGHHAHVTGLSREEEAFYSYASPGVDALGCLAEDGPPPPGLAMQMLREALLLHDDHRFRVADHCIKRLEALLALDPEALRRTGHSPAEQTEVAKAWEDAKVKEGVASIKRRWAEVAAVIRDMNEAGEWIHGQTAWGIHTEYQLNGEGQIRIRLKGDMVGRMIDQVAVIRESNHYQDWLPFCSDSRLLHATKMNVALWFHLAIPLFARDAIIETYGVDNEGAILFLQDKPLTRLGAEDRPAYDKVWDARSVIPPPEPKGWGACRMTVVDFNCKMDITGPESFHTTMILTLDLHAPVPAWIVNLATKKVAGLFLYLITKETTKMGQCYDSHPVAAIMRRDPWYRLYLEPRFRDYFAQRDWKGFHSGALEGTAEPATLHRLRTRSVSRLAEAARQGTPIPPTHAPAAPARQLDAKEVAKAFGAGPEEEEDGDGNDVSSPIPLRFSPIPGASAAGADAGAAPATASPGRGGLFGFARFLSSPPKSAPGAMPTGGKLRPRPQHTTRSTQEYEQEQGQAPLMRPSATPIHVSIVPRSPARGGRGKGRTTTVKVAALVKTWGPLVAVVVVAWLLAWLLVAVRVEAAALGSRGDGQRAAGRGRSWRSLL